MVKIHKPRIYMERTVLLPLLQSFLAQDRSKVLNMAWKKLLNWEWMKGWVHKCVCVLGLAWPLGLVLIPSKIWTPILNKCSLFYFLNKFQTHKFCECVRLRCVWLKSKCCHFYVKVYPAKSNKIRKYGLLCIAQRNKGDEQTPEKRRVSSSFLQFEYLFDILVGLLFTGYAMSDVEQEGNVNDLPVLSTCTYASIHWTMWHLSHLLFEIQFKTKFDIFTISEWAEKPLCLDESQNLAIKI